MNSSTSTTDPVDAKLRRCSRIADLMTSCHAKLRDTYEFYALLLDVAVLILTLWVTALAFADDQVAAALFPSRLSKEIWIGTLGVIAFALSLVQLRVDWKTRAGLHQAAFRRFAEAKRILADANASPDEQPRSDALRTFDDAARNSASIPENQFLHLKRAHLQKVAISRLLDRHPGASIRLTRVRMWWRDSFSRMP